MRYLLRYVMNLTMPAHGDMPGIKDTKADAFLDEFGKHAHPIIRLGFYLSIFIYAFSPIFTIKIPLPVFLLSSAKQELHLAKYSQSHNILFSQLWMLQKMIVGLCWGADDAVRNYFGYDPLPGDPGTFQTGVPETNTHVSANASEETGS